jgi:hypothetical protein
MASHIDPSKWRPAKRGEPGYESRWFYPKSVKHASGKTKHVSRSQVLKVQRGGLTAEQYARLNPAFAGLLINL